MSEMLKDKWEKYDKSKKMLETADELRNIDEDVSSEDDKKIDPEGTESD